MKNNLMKEEIVLFLENLQKVSPQKEVQIIGRVIRDFSKEDWNFVASNFKNEQKNRIFNVNIILSKLFGAFNNLSAPIDKASFLLKTASNSGLYLLSAKKAFTFKILTKSNIAFFTMTIFAAGSIRILDHVRLHLENELSSPFSIHSESKEDLAKTILFLEKLNSILMLATSGIISNFMLKFFSKKTS